MIPLLAGGLIVTLIDNRRRLPHGSRALLPLLPSLPAIAPVLAAWGNARLAPDQRSMVLVDAETGTEAEPVVVDRATGRRVDGSDFVFTAGPAASKPFRDRYQDRPTPTEPRLGRATGATNSQRKTAPTKPARRR